MEPKLKKLAEGYQQFEQNHEQLREQLLKSLPVPSWQFREAVGAKAGRAVRFRLPTIRAAVSAAAVLLIVFGVLMVNTMQPNPADTSQMAFAAAMEESRQLDSIHVRMTTPSANDSSSVEVWWVRPDKFKMEFSGGLVIASDGKTRYSYVPKTNTLTLREAGGPDLEMFILSETGHPMFTNNEVPGINGWMDESQVVSSVDVDYKGEKCIKIRSVSTEDGTIFEYILDQEEPVIYDVKRLWPDGRVKSHTVVLERDMAFDEVLFQVDGADKRIVDHR